MRSLLRVYEKCGIYIVLLFVIETALPNICPSGIKQAPHPTDDTKYLMCDDEDQLLLVQCPLNEYYCKNIKHCNTSCI